MQQANDRSIHQTGTTSARQVSIANQQSQQQPNNANGGWRCEVFVDTPMTRELMHGPLNIHLPPLQLPIGLTNLMGNLAIGQRANQQQSQELERQTSTTIAIGDAPVSGGGQPDSPPQQQGNQQATQRPKSPMSVASHGRANSTPAALNSSDRSSSNGSGSSFVVNIDDEVAPTNHIHRRRSSSPLRGSGSRHFDISSNTSQATQLTQRTTSAVVQANNVDQNVTNPTTGTSEDSSADDEEDATIRNLRTRFRELLRRRHQIFRNFIQQTGEFPSLYVFGVLVCWTIVILSALIQFFTVEFTACLALLFCLFHYSDVIAFKRYIYGTGKGWLIAGKILVRQFMVLQVLGQSTYIFPAVTFREVSVSSVPNPTFWSTLYIVLISEYFIMDFLLAIKLAIAYLPKCSTIYKRRFYQWLEYSGALYRFAIPFVQWNAYLGTLWWTLLYGGIKILLVFAMLWGWILTTLRIFRFSHLGTTPSTTEQNENCTICFSEYTSPVKLKCSHIFCSECIRTWLDRERTCPICRAIVTKEDNNFRNGESMFPSIF